MTACSAAGQRRIRCRVYVASVKRVGRRVYGFFIPGLASGYVRQDQTPGTYPPHCTRFGSSDCSFFWAPAWDSRSLRLSRGSVIGTNLATTSNARTSTCFPRSRSGHTQRVPFGAALLKAGDYHGLNCRAHRSVSCRAHCWSMREPMVSPTQIPCTAETGSACRLIFGSRLSSANLGKRTHRRGRSSLCHTHALRLSAVLPFISKSILCR